MDDLKKHFTPDYNNKDIWDWLAEDTTVPYVKLDMHIPWKDIYAEALAIKDKCIVHREDEGGGTWKSICIHGVDAEYTNDWIYYDVCCWCSLFLFYNNHTFNPSLFGSYIF